MTPTTVLANLVEKTVEYEVKETLIFRGDKAPITLDPKYIKRGISCPMSSNIEYRSEHYNNPISAYKWSWFDHHDDLIAIQYIITIK